MLAGLLEPPLLRDFPHPFSPASLRLHLNLRTPISYLYQGRNFHNLYNRNHWNLSRARTLKKTKALRFPAGETFFSYRYMYQDFTQSSPLSSTGTRVSKHTCQFIFGR